MNSMGGWRVYQYILECGRNLSLDLPVVLVDQGLREARRSNGRRRVRLDLQRMRETSVESQSVTGEMCRKNKKMVLYAPCVSVWALMDA